MFVQSFVDEFTRYRLLGAKAIAQASDGALNHVPVGDGNSIAMLVRHVSGNLTSRFTDFLTTDGEKPTRDRDGEFVDGFFSREEITAAWASGFEVVERELADLIEDDLQSTVTIRGTELSVHEALSRSIAHTAMHTGQIILLAKIEAGDRWTTLSIPRGQSAQYNANPTLEKRPAR
ncbi:MAG TPA: DUF1572 family protein [Gemmatimonadaceae bacterium]|jgi:hypothetical protein